MLPHYDFSSDTWWGERRLAFEGRIVVWAWLIWLCLHFICQHWWKRFWIHVSHCHPCSKPSQVENTRISHSYFNKPRQLPSKDGVEIIFSLLIEPCVDKVWLQWIQKMMEKVIKCFTFAFFLIKVNLSELQWKHMNYIYHIKFFNIHILQILISNRYKGPLHITPRFLSASASILWSLNTAFDVVSKSFKTIYHFLNKTNNVLWHQGANPCVCKPASTGFICIIYVFSDWLDPGL